MDVEAALSLVSGAASAAVSGAATAAGQKAWQSLLTLARRATGRSALADSSGVAAAEDVDPADAQAVQTLTERIAERAHADAAFAEELCGWAEDHRAVIQVDRAEVHNTVSGDARISGPVVQARDIQGGITF